MRFASSLNVNSCLTTQNESRTFEENVDEFSSTSVMWLPSFGSDSKAGL